MVTFTSIRGWSMALAASISAGRADSGSLSNRLFNKGQGEDLLLVQLRYHY